MTIDCTTFVTQDKSEPPKTKIFSHTVSLLEESVEDPDTNGIPNPSKTIVYQASLPILYFSQMFYVYSLFGDIPPITYILSLYTKTVGLDLYIFIGAIFCHFPFLTSNL